MRMKVLVVDGTKKWRRFIKAALASEFKTQLTFAFTADARRKFMRATGKAFDVILVRCRRAEEAISLIKFLRARHEGPLVAMSTRPGFSAFYDAGCDGSWFMLNREGSARTLCQVIEGLLKDRGEDDE